MRAMQSVPRLACLQATVPVAVLVLVAGCGSSATTSTAPASLPRCGISLNVSETTLPASGGAGSLRVTATRECAWSAAVEASWLSINSGASGQGEGTVEFAAAANPDPQARGGAVVVNGTRAQITQSAGACVITLAQSSADFPSAGGTGRIEVRASSPLCTWAAAADSPWVEITSGANGSGNGAVTISVAPTTGPPRAGSLTIAGQQFSVTQSQGCSYAIDRNAHDAAAAGGAGSVAVITAAACPWTASSNVGWITVDPPTGTGPGAVTFNVAPTAGPGRTGTAVIAGQLFTVTQSPGCSYQVHPTTHSIGTSGGTATVSVSTPDGCSWTAASEASWISILGPTSGNGSGSVTLSVAATTGPARSAVLTVAGQQVSVSQTQGCTFSISPETQSVAPSGGTGTVAVTAGAGCPWTATSSAPWATVTSGSNGSGNGEVRFSVAATSGPGRSATLTIAGRTFTINQGQGCSYALAPSSVDLGNGGGQGTFEVQAATGCGWTASTSTPWITIDSGASGSGNGTVRFTAAANAGPGRNGSITAGGRTFTVNQGQGCTYALAPSSVDLGNGGGQGTFEVQAATGCGWTASTSTPWITIDSGASGSGNGTVRFTAAANAGPGRNGSITAGGRTFTVNQGQGCTFALSAERHSAPAEGGTGRVDVTAGAGCGWTVSSHADWLTIASGTGGSGNGAVSFQAAANTGPARSGTLSIAGHTFTVDQAGGCTYAIAPASQTTSAAGGDAVVDVTAPASCAWTAASNAAWIAVTAGETGAGPGIVRLTIEPNLGPPRAGTVTVAGQAATINQEGGCAFTVAPEAIGAPAVKSAALVHVTTLAACEWTAASQESWITVTAGASGTGSGAVGLLVRANIGPARSGTVLVAGRAVTVSQQSGCSIEISPASATVPAAGGAGSVAVAAGVGCEWTAVSSTDWIVVTSGASGSGDGVVQFSVAANPTESARSATIAIGGQTFTVNQQ